MVIEMYWHGFPCWVLTEPVYKPGVKRNCLIELNGGVVKGKRLVVSRRSLRKRGVS